MQSPYAAQFYDGLKSRERVHFILALGEGYPWFELHVDRVTVVESTSR